MSNNINSITYTNTNTTEMYIFENHRNKSIVSGMTLTNKRDIDRYFSSNNLYGNDPHPFCDIDGNSMIQYVTNSNTHNYNNNYKHNHQSNHRHNNVNHNNGHNVIISININNQRYQCGEWIYMPDFGLDDIEGSIECKQTSYVRYRIWSIEHHVSKTNDEIRATLSIPNCDKYAFNLYSIRSALKNISHSVPLDKNTTNSTTSNNRQSDVMVDECLIPRNTITPNNNGSSNSNDSKIYDTFVVTEYR